MTWRAIFALMVSYSAFLSEIFRAGIEAVPKPQVEGAYALGLSRLADVPLRRPAAGDPHRAAAARQRLRRDDQGFARWSRRSASRTSPSSARSTPPRPSCFFETYNVVAFLYLVMTIGLSLLVRALERRLKAQGLDGDLSLSPTTTMCSRRGPWAPSSSVCSMSAERDGPVTHVDRARHLPLAVAGSAACPTPPRSRRRYRRP